jgi:Fe-S oxidoreductase
LKIDEVTLRGELDRQIDERSGKATARPCIATATAPATTSIPTTPCARRGRPPASVQQSPKGRASLIREWLRLQGEAGVDVLSDAIRRPAFFRNLWTRWRNSRGQSADFSHEVYDAMAGCLACKSCAGQCPVKVNVPEFRSRFLELYHSRYLRPARDYLIASLEYSIPYMARIPALYNGLMGAAFVRQQLERLGGMVDVPLLSRFDFHAALRRWKVQPATVSTLSALTPAQRERSVVWCRMPSLVTSRRRCWRICWN